MTSLHEHRRPYCRAVLGTRRRRLGRSCTRQLDLCPHCTAAALSRHRRAAVAARRARSAAPVPPYRTSGPDELAAGARPFRSEEHTSELQSLMRISYAVFCLKKKKKRDSYELTYNIK